MLFHVLLTLPSDIFHEVRVPFNAIVLGAEQLALQVAEVPGETGLAAQELTSMISEQAKVVSFRVVGPERVTRGAGPTAY